jgi:hypothetical protein
MSGKLTTQPDPVTGSSDAHLLQYKLHFQTGAEGTTEYFDHQTAMSNDTETSADGAANHIGLATGLLGSSSACAVVGTGRELGEGGEAAVVRGMEVGEAEETALSKEIGSKPRCSTTSHQKQQLLLLLLLPLLLLILTLLLIRLYYYYTACVFYCFVISLL